MFREDKSGLWNRLHGLIDRVVRHVHIPRPPAPRPVPPPAPVVNFPIPAGSLVFVKHDGVARNGKGDPETHKSLSDRFFTVTPELNALIRGVLHLANPGMSDSDFEHQFESLFAYNRAFSNKHGWDGSFAIENLICGGATRRAVTGVPYRAAGETWLDVYALDIDNLPAVPATLADVDWTLWFYAVVATQDKAGNFRADPFPQFGGHCPIPFLGKGGVNAIPVSLLVPVASIQHPFSPAHFDITSLGQ